MPRDAGDLLHGTLDLLVMRALVTEPLHGFALSRWIDQRTNGDLGVADSALYKALHRGRVGSLRQQSPRQVLLAVAARQANAPQ